MNGGGKITRSELLKVLAGESQCQQERGEADIGQLRRDCSIRNEEERRLRHARDRAPGSSRTEGQDGAQSGYGRDDPDSGEEDGEVSCGEVGQGRLVSAKEEMRARGRSRTAGRACRISPCRAAFTDASAADGLPGNCGTLPSQAVEAKGWRVPSVAWIGGQYRYRY